MHRNPDARTLALEALEALERRDAFAEAVLNGLLSRHPSLAPRDRGLVSHLVYGVLRWRNRLDAHIAAAATRPLAKVQPRVLQVLRLGVYQILFLDRVPNRAAVSESVELARRAGLAHAAGFVNAVLRNAAALGADLPPADDPAERAALEFGCPRWLVEAWTAEYGQEGAVALCRAASRIPQLWLRVHTPRAARPEAIESLRQQGFDAEEGEFGPEAVWVGAAGDPRAIDLVAAGRAVVQDQASQLIPHLVGPGRGWRILDACAGPGLKATHLAALGGGGTRITAVDIHPHRARMIQELAARLGLAGIEVEVGDARRFRSSEPFDAVLADAPCSGLGVLDRNPEAKWRLGPAELAVFPPLQLEILEGVAGSVRPGGLLVYATCTTARAENEGVVASFLSRRPDFRLERPVEGPASRPELVSPGGYFRTFPGPSAMEGTGALDGFFGARLRRAER